ncbi:Cellulase (glycosyl hydrolase family 5) [Granulicella rosea]|uniref:Cellulase (Glycosyl hydrolase family 5) n=1 Tax=Granulicella rosea TaxID=474952 RepID=A0A239DR98_9BACT|nr:cellulase family glycosylhydrolase [Granulicella rosea]SNS35030.1 Cellulase (glycosyl hydrolase family 5) [Granulicella rosea]
MSMKHLGTPSPRRHATWLLSLAALLLCGVTGQAQLTALHASGTNIVNAAGTTVQLKGVNLGGWFIMEPYMTPIDSSGTYNTDMHGMMVELDSRLGVANEQALLKTYQQSWITTADLDNIHAAGLNAVRIPIWWGMFFPMASQSTSNMRSDSFTVLDSIINACASRNIYVILDMHGALGSQSGNADTGHANDGGSNGTYFSSGADQSLTLWLWEQIASHYSAANFANSAAIAGFDLLNEPTGGTTTQVVGAYNSLYAGIRGVDSTRMLIMETISSTSWAWNNLPSPATNGWTNVVYSTHQYTGVGSTAAQVEAGNTTTINGFNAINTAGYNVPGYVGEYTAYASGYSEWQSTQTEYANAGLSRTAWAYKVNTASGSDFWGWYCPGTTRPTTPNIATDPYATIQSDWSGWTTSPDFVVNTNIHM